MASGFRLIPPRHVPPLDSGFRPAVLANRAFRADVAASGVGVPLVLGLERADGYAVALRDRGRSPTDTRVPRPTWSVRRAPRQVPALGSAAAGSVLVGGPRVDRRAHRAASTQPGGVRAFDAEIMVSGPTTGLSRCTSRLPPDRIPPARARRPPLGGHLDGCRVGFDLGASDLQSGRRHRRRGVYSEEFLGIRRTSRPGMALRRPFDGAAGGGRSICRGWMRSAEFGGGYREQ